MTDASLHFAETLPEREARADILELGGEIGREHGGVRFHVGDLAALLRRIAPAPRRGQMIAVCNTHMLVSAARDPALAEAMRSAAFALCDGQPVAWLLSLLAGRRVPRITGPDLLEAALAGRLGTGRIALVGGSASARARLAARLPEARRGDFLFLDPGSVAEGEGPSEEIGAGLRAFAPRLVFVGLGCPKQEKWMAKAIAEVPATFIGVGAAFDYGAGEIRRAPRALQILGCEWLHRMTQQPRLARRYLTTLGPFLLILARGLWAAGAARRLPGRAAPFEVRQP